MVGRVLIWNEPDGEISSVDKYQFSTLFSPSWLMRTPKIYFFGCSSTEPDVIDFMTNNILVGRLTSG